MAVYDWTKVFPGLFHDFHQTWALLIRDALNRELLPPEMYALVEQYGSKGRLDRVIPDVITLKRTDWGSSGNGGGTMLKAPPKKHTSTLEIDAYLHKKNVVAIRHVSNDEIVAMIEIISPGNKSGPKALNRTVKKLTGLVQRGVHLLLIDLFPTSPRSGRTRTLHQMLWHKWSSGGKSVEPSPEGKPLSVLVYEVKGQRVRSFVEPFGFDENVPDGTLFLAPMKTVTIPLHELYQQAWETVPRRWRDEMETPVTA